jgi:hypothetical protein
MQLRRIFLILDCRFLIVGSATVFFLKGQRRMSSSNQQSKFINQNSQNLIHKLKIVAGDV